MARFEKIIDEDYMGESTSGMLSIANYKSYFGDLKLGDEIEVIDPTGISIAIHTTIHRGQWRIDGLAELYNRHRVRKGDKAIVEVDPENHKMTIIFERKDKNQAEIENGTIIQKIQNLETY